MNFRIERKGFTFYIGFNRTEMVDGYNSLLPSGKHFLMWDFDNVALHIVKAMLLLTQRKHKLPRIWILSSGKENCWHANCFKSLWWSDCRAMIAENPLVDKKFLAIGILRGFFTLRYSPVGGKEIEPACILPSKVPEDVDPFELRWFSTYPKKRR